MRPDDLLIALALAMCSTACTKKDAEIVNRKGSTLDDFSFTPKPAPMLAASGPASQPTGAASTAASQPRMAARKGSTLDTFVFKPKSAADLAASSGGRK